MMSAVSNIDNAELTKFDAVAHQYWDAAGPLHTLHSINPVRAAFIAARVPLSGAAVADVGCGGGLLAEALARAGGEKERAALLLQQAKEDAQAVNDEKLLARIAALDK